MRLEHDMRMVVLGSPFHKFDIVVRCYADENLSCANGNGIINNVPAILHNKHEMVEKSEHRMIVAVQNSSHDEIPPL